MRVIPLLLAALIIVFVEGVRAQHEHRDARAIAMVKALNVSRLDKHLHVEPFAKWFGKLVGKKQKVEWEVNDCGEQDGSGRQRDFPICVQSFAHTGNSVEVTVMVAVGTYMRGIVGKPAVWGIWLKPKNMESELMDELSDLVHKLDQLQHRKS